MVDGNGTGAGPPGCPCGRGSSPGSLVSHSGAQGIAGSVGPRVTEGLLEAHLGRWWPRQAGTPWCPLGGSRRPAPAPAPEAHDRPVSAPGRTGAATLAAEGADPEDICVCLLRVCSLQGHSSLVDSPLSSGHPTVPTVPRQPVPPSPGSASPEQPQSLRRLAVLVTRPPGSLLVGCAVPTKGPSALGCPLGNDRRKGGAGTGSAGGASLSPRSSPRPAWPERPAEPARLWPGRLGSPFGATRHSVTETWGADTSRLCRAVTTVPFASEAGASGPVPAPADQGRAHAGMQAARHHISDLDRFTRVTEVL